MTCGEVEHGIDAWEATAELRSATADPERWLEANVFGSNRADRAPIALIDG